MLTLLSKIHSAYSVNPETVRELIENGADFNYKDNLGQTPLHNAVKKGHEEMVDVLLAAGADPNCRNNNREFPLQSVATGRDRRIIRSLLEYGADPNLPTTFKYGGTSIHRPAKNCFFDTVELLLENGANANALDDNGFTPLHWASNGKIYPYERGRTIMALLAHGADIRLETKYGSTALQLAKRQGIEEIIDLLEIAEIKSR